MVAGLEFLIEENERRDVYSHVHGASSVIFSVQIEVLAESDRVAPVILARWRPPSRFHLLTALVS